jgi:hypothetical protein
LGKTFILATKILKILGASDVFELGFYHTRVSVPKNEVNAVCDDGGFLGVHIYRLEFFSGNIKIILLPRSYRQTHHLDGP